ncbi:MAG: molybdopterin-guanine dinucleotide biosynthesis protein B [Nitrospirae bacterium]|nr:molybdopterin-guanine dinucleotide biosynthesis protein B [Nitrospirota bacterium]
MIQTKTSIPVICFVGSSSSGKTTLIEKVIGLLARKGYDVATVKHTHKNVSMDTEGKDSRRHKEAGAKTVVLASPSQFSVVSDSDSELTIEDILERFISKADILIVEGFKRDSYPKIEVSRNGSGNDLRCLNDPSIIAVASDKLLNLTIPAFDINNAEGITGFIEERFLQDKQ